ncbi:hypothetical protein Tco_1293250 [Tanacetum coccineum]
MSILSIGQMLFPSSVPDTKLLLYPLQDKLSSRDKSLDLSTFKLSRLFLSLLSSGSSSCWRSYGPQQNSKEGDSSTRETNSIQMDKEFQSNDSFEVAPQHEVNETNESQALATRTLNRERRRPGWHSDYIMESN